MLGVSGVGKRDFPFKGQKLEQGRRKMLWECEAELAD